MEVRKFQSALFALLLLTTPFSCLGKDETSGKSEKEEKESYGVGVLKELGKYGAVAGGAAVATAKTATAALAAAGFTGSGVVASSWAALFQGTVGNVIGGTAFASMQSIAATGGFAVLGPVGIAGAGVATAAYGAYRYSYMGDNEENNKDPSSVKTKKN